MDYCSLAYLAAILQKKKLAFQVWETTPVNIPSRIARVLTLERLLSKVKDNAHVMLYLPDDPRTHAPKEFVTTVLNSIDSSFMKRCQDEVVAKLP